MGGIYIESSDDLPYGPGNPDYEYDAQVQRQLDAEAQAERDVWDAHWWEDKLGGLSLAADAANALARCMRNLDAACKGCPVSRDAITTALSNLQKLARADARDEELLSR